MSLASLCTGTWTSTSLLSCWIRPMRPCPTTGCWPQRPAIIFKATTQWANGQTWRLMPMISLRFFLEIYFACMCTFCIYIVLHVYIYLLQVLETCLPMWNSLMEVYVHDISGFSQFIVLACMHSLYITSRYLPATL